MTSLKHLVGCLLFATTVNMSSLPVQISMTAVTIVKQFWCQTSTKKQPLAFAHAVEPDTPQELCTSLFIVFSDKKIIYFRFKWGKCSPSDRSSQDVERSVTDSHYSKLLVIIPFYCFMPLTQSVKVSFPPAYNNLAHISSNAIITLWIVSCNFGWEEWKFVISMYVSHGDEW